MPESNEESKAAEASPEIPVEVTPDQPAAPSAEEQQAAALKEQGEKLAALEKEKKELNERFLRTAADFDNFRKRSRKDLDDARAKSKEDVLREMLPVVDNLERALEAVGSAGGASGGAIADGVKLVLRQFIGQLDRFEVKAFASVGQPFDPARHEAISQVETADQPPGSVVTELQKGYLIGAKLLRPAMVAVARPPSAPPPAAPAEEKPAEAAPAEAAPAEGAGAASTASSAPTDAPPTDPEVDQTARAPGDGGKA